MKSIIFILILLFSLSSIAQDSVQDLVGPHGGYLRSAGEFYSEAVAQKDGSFFVYLLNNEQIEPTIRYSYVAGFLELKPGLKSEILCVAKEVHFECHPRGVKLGKGTRLLLNLARKYVIGKDVEYDVSIFNIKDEPVRKKRTKKKKKAKK